MNRQMNFLVQTCSIGSAVIVRVTYDSALVGDLPEADLGFYKGGCPINLKGHRRSRTEGAKVVGVWAVPPPQKICVFLISKCEFLCISGGIY